MCFFLIHIFTVICLLTELQYNCRQQSSFVCERHTITSVEINPLEPVVDGLPCEKGSIAFRNKV